MHNTSAAADSFFPTYVRGLVFSYETFAIAHWWKTVCTKYSKISSDCHSQKEQKLVFKTNNRLMPEHSAILLTFIKLPFVIKIFILSIFEWPLQTGFTGLCIMPNSFSTKTVKF